MFLHRAFALLTYDVFTLAICLVDLHRPFALLTYDVFYIGHLPCVLTLQPFALIGDLSECVLISLVVGHLPC